MRVQLVHDDTLELVNRYDGAITAHQLDLQPEDRVTCRQNQIVIHRTRAEGGVAEEPLRNISEYAQELTVEGDGSLLVRTRIMNQSKSAFSVLRSSRRICGSFQAARLVRSAKYRFISQVQSDTPLAAHFHSGPTLRDRVMTVD